MPKMEIDWDDASIEYIAREGLECLDPLLW